MPSPSRILRAIGIALCAAFIGTGCASTSITAVGDAKLTVIPLGDTPFGVSPWIYKLSDSAFAVIRNPADTEIRVEKYDGNATRLWSTPISIAPLNSSIILFVNFDKWEQQIDLFQRNDHLILLTSRQGENDSMYVTGRVLDAATGALIRTRTLDSMPKQIFVDKQFQSYRYFADTNHIIFEAYGFDRDKKTYNMRIVKVSDDLSSSTASTITLDDESSLGSVNHLWFDSLGVLNTLSLRPPDTVRFMQYDFTTGAPTHSASTLLSDSSNSSSHPRSIALLSADHGEMLILAPMVDGDDILGTASTRLDVAHATFDSPLLYRFSEKRLEELFDDDEYSDAPLHTLLESDSERGHYIMAFEQYGSEFRKRSEYYQTGDALLMAFDRSGQPTWQQGLRKSSNWSEMFTSALTMSVDVSARGTVRIVYRDGSNLDVTEYRLDDGTEVPGARRHLLDMGAGAFNKGGATTWLGDNTLLFLLQQGFSSPDWSIGIIRTK